MKFCSQGHNCVLPLPRKFRYGNSNGLGNIRGTNLRLRLKVACHTAQVMLTDNILEPVAVPMCLCLHSAEDTVIVLERGC